LRDMEGRTIFVGVFCGFGKGEIVRFQEMCFFCNIFGVFGWRDARIFNNPQIESVVALWD